MPTFARRSTALALSGSAAAGRLRVAASDDEGGGIGVGRGRLLGSALVGGMCMAMLAGGLPAFAAGAGNGEPASTTATTAALPTSALSADAVSLITGDRVQLLKGADGEPTVAFEAAPRDDGRPVGYSSFGDDGHFYVIPTDVAPLVPGQLDLSLFDILMLQDLADDEDRAGVPVIVQTTDAPDEPAKRSLSALGVEPEQTLESISSIAGEVAPEGAPELVDAVESSEAVGKVWLDAPMQVLDEDSNPQIGAPAAWEGGQDGTGATVAVLDSGIDTTHPDLDEGVVMLERDFTGSGDAGDALGHGTHVASIIAGTGEASGGENRGVAPGARLLNGRVLDGEGMGDTSWAIEGLEWAAENGADVINMSLGERGQYTDGTDPGAMAVNSISERYDTLVVVAAGNEGNNGTATTVTTPGTADLALTVGAVNDDDVLTSFSAMGPRFGDWAIKPDIVAPGEGIVAARAAGVVADVPVGEYYRVDSGTSMAAPAAAGAAAILAVARPELDAQALKAVLMGSANHTGNHVFAQGSGRVWIPGALGQTVYATPASLSFGHFVAPRGDQAPRTKTLTYTNTAAADVELHLSSTLTPSDRSDVPDGLLTLSAETLTVPAGGEASVDVIIDPHADDPDVYQGEVLAVGAGFTPVRSVIAFGSEPDLFTLRVEGIQRGGAPADQSSTATLYGIDDDRYYRWFDFAGGTGEVRLPVGRYALLGQIFSAASPDARFHDGVTNFSRDLDIQADTTLVLDAGTATPIEVETEKKSKVNAIDAGISRTLPGRAYPVSVSLTTAIGGPIGGVAFEVSVLPQEDPLAGEVRLSSRFMLHQPLLDVSAVAKRSKLDVSRELSYGLRSPKLTGDVSAPLVDAGSGTAEQLAAAGAEGAVVLIENRPDTALNDLADAALDAGAVAAIVYGDSAGPFFESVNDNVMRFMPEKALPTLTLARDTGLELVELARAGAKLKGTGIETPSYQYALAYLEEGGIPSDLTYAADAGNTAQVDVDVKAFTPGTPMVEYVVSQGGGTYVGFGFRFTGPLVDRTVYYSTDEGITFQRKVQPADRSDAYPSEFASAAVTYRPRERADETFVGQAHHGGFLPSPATPQAASVWRDGDILTVDLPYRVDGDGHAQIYGPDDQSTGRFQMWVDDEQVVDSEYSNAAQTVAAEEHEYRIRLETHRDVEWWPMSTDVSTEWGFRSTATDEASILPLLQVDYGVTGLNALNTAGRKTELDLQVSHQDGSAGGGTIEGLKLWSSADGGTVWDPVRVTTRSGSGAYTATITAPKGATSISLRSEAWDSAGATFAETVIDAFAVDSGAPKATGGVR